MKGGILITLFGLLVIPAAAQLKDDLLKEIDAWKIGETPPARLLKFPDGNIDTIAECGLRAIGDEVGDYVSKIDNSDLLEALLFDVRNNGDCLRAAARRLIQLKGVDYLAELIALKSREDASLLSRTDLAVLSQLLRSPYIAVKVACIRKQDMALDSAEKVLAEMKADLESGRSWSEVYRKFADQHPDMADRKKDAKSSRTLICYLYDGIISSTRFDVLNYTTAEHIPSEHVHLLFQANRSVTVMQTTSAVYLYVVEKRFRGGGQY